MDRIRINMDKMKVTYPLFFVLFLNKPLNG